VSQWLQAKKTQCLIVLNLYVSKEEEKILRGLEFIFSKEIKGGDEKKSKKCYQGII
jgi:hypothetical protein